jgi:hypothetical protein
MWWHITPVQRWLPQKGFKKRGLRVGEVDKVDIYSCRKQEQNKVVYLLTFATVTNNTKNLSYIYLWHLFHTLGQWLSSDELGGAGLTFYLLFSGSMLTE